MTKKILMMLTMAVTVGAFAQGRAGRNRNAEPPARSAAAAKPSDPKEVPALNWEKAPVDMVLQAYGDQRGMTILKDPGVPEGTTISLKSRDGQKLTKDEYLEAIEVVLEMNGVHVEPYGTKFIRAIPRNNVRKDGIPLYMSIDDVPPAYREGRVISVCVEVRNIGVEDAQKALDNFKSSQGQLLVFERSGSILITDTWLNIKRMLKIVELIDTETKVQDDVFVRQIKNASANDIKAALELIVQESQKELEKNKGAASNNIAQQPQQSHPRSLLDIGKKRDQQTQPAGNESKVISDADRGMIRGKVLIIADERSNKLVVITQKANMDFFDKVIEQLDIETTPDTVVKVYRLKYADAEEVSDMINDLIGNSGRSSNTKGNQNANAKNGTGGNVTNGRATAQKKSVNQRSGDAKAGELTKDNTTVLSDKRINGLVVMTEKELVPTIEQIIESMDVKLSQVLIETVIVEVTLGDDLTTGIDWVRNGRYDTQVQAQDSYGRPLYWKEESSTDDDGNVITKMIQTVEDTGVKVLTGGTVKNSFWSGDSSFASAMSGGADTKAVVNLASGVTGVATNLMGSAFNYIFKSDALNLSAIVQASKTDNRAKYLASPIVMTVDNKEATIDATETRKFFSGYETSSSYSTYMRTPKYDSKDIGIKIKVKPKINPNGTVMLNIDEEYSQLGAGQSILVGDGAGKETIDTALTRKMTADALLENMQTVILCGLTETYAKEVENGIPILKDIPWIGKWLFGHVQQTEDRKELLIFMTPYVLDDGESAQAEAIRRKKSLSISDAWDDHGWSKSILADPISKKEQLRRLKDEWKKQDEERKTRIAIEEEKVKRVKKLQEMDEEERNLWLEMHKEELEKERQEELEKKMEDPKSQEELRKLAAEIREKKLKEAAEVQKHSEDDQKQRVAEGEAAEKAAREEADAGAAAQAEDVKTE